MTHALDTDDIANGMSFTAAMLGDGVGAADLANSSREASAAVFPLARAAASPSTNDGVPPLRERTGQRQSEAPLKDAAWRRAEGRTTPPQQFAPAQRERTTHGGESFTDAFHRTRGGEDLQLNLHNFRAMAWVSGRSTNAFSSR